MPAEENKKDEANTQETKNTNEETNASTASNSIETKLIQEIQKKMEEIETEKKAIEKDYEELQETAKRAQYDYINLKMDFDRYRNQQEEAKKSQKVELLLETVKKFLPFVENLRKSLDTVSDEIKETPLGKGVQIVYNKFETTLGTMNIKAIDAMGLEPDNLLHEPVSMAPAPSDELKGKIIQEFERGYVYEKDEDKRVVTTSKVVVGQ